MTKKELHHIESNFMVITDAVVYCADVVDNILRKPFSKWQYNSAASQTTAAKMPIKLNQQHVSETSFHKNCIITFMKVGFIVELLY